MRRGTRRHREDKPKIEVSPAQEGEKRQISSLVARREVNRRGAEVATSQRSNSSWANLASTAPRPTPMLHWTDEGGVAVAEELAAYS